MSVRRPFYAFPLRYISVADNTPTDTDGKVTNTQRKSNGHLPDETYKKRTRNVYVADNVSVGRPFKVLNMHKTFNGQNGHERTRTDKERISTERNRMSNGNERIPTDVKN